MYNFSLLLPPDAFCACAVFLLWNECIIIVSSCRIRIYSKSIIIINLYFAFQLTTSKEEWCTCAFSQKQKKKKTNGEENSDSKRESLLCSSSSCLVPFGRFVSLLTQPFSHSAHYLLLIQEFPLKRKPGSFYFTLYILFLFLAFPKNILPSWRRYFVFHLIRRNIASIFCFFSVWAAFELYKERTKTRPTTLYRLTWFCPFYEVKYKVVNERGRVEIQETYVFSVHIITGMGL